MRAGRVCAGGPEVAHLGRPRSTAGVADALVARRRQGRAFKRHSTEPRPAPNVVFSSAGSDPRDNRGCAQAPEGGPTGHLTRIAEAATVQLPGVRSISTAIRSDASG